MLIGLSTSIDSTQQYHPTGAQQLGTYLVPSPSPPKQGIAPAHHPLPKKTHTFTKGKSFSIPLKSFSSRLCHAFTLQVLVHLKGKNVKVTKELLDLELQSLYGQFRTVIAINKRKWGLKIMDGIVRLTTKRQKVAGVTNETEYILSSTTPNHKIRTRIYRPKGAKQTLPAMVYFHGGGYMMGAPEIAHAFYADVLERRDIVIVAPDYRKSQILPFPAGFIDCYDVLLWVRDHANQLNIDPNKIIEAGHSAGGGMTAAITLKTRDTQDVKLAFQMPIYPMIDHRMTTASSKMLGSTMWDAEINAQAWRRYLRDIKGAVPAYASPALNDNYSGFPPTISFVGDLEPFHDENVAYIEALKNADVPVKFKIFKGAYHGFEIGSAETTMGKAGNQFQLDAFEEFYDKYVQ